MLIGNESMEEFVKFIDPSSSTRSQHVVSRRACDEQTSLVHNGRMNLNLLKRSYPEVDAESNIISISLSDGGLEWLKSERS